MSGEAQDLIDGAIAPAENTRLFGHGAAERFLAQSYRSGKGHHALLLEGPKGIGKATLAFRFANHVLNHPDPGRAPETITDPDPDAAVTRQIVAGASHHLLHLTRLVDPKTGKAKSAISVDEVRRAGKFFSQTSGTGNWRIVVIDPADDLNRSAANAILKILEEPPKRAMFLVITHAPGKLLPTIRSRCLPLRLEPLAPPALEAAAAHLGIDTARAPVRRALSAAGGSVARLLTLVNHGGLEIAEAFEKALAGEGPAQRKAMLALADVVSAKDNDIVHGFFTDLADTHLTAAARQAALSGDLDRAGRLASLSSAITERLSIAEAYNLDRKQTVMSILQDLAS
ncbi:DNA polymerase III subunit delta' [Ensifer soli]|uniref:DNA polymerase III subunit delta' n=1 Tax=Ciceribacter sp. sgz301302 TaxID=3342379 RepID=UPI0035BB7D61